MIENISTSLLEAEELMTLASRIQKLIQEVKLNNAYVESALRLLQGDIDALNAALTRDKASALTLSVQERDKRRDKAFIGLRTAIEAYTHHLEDEPSALAEKLLAIFRKYGTRLHREGYSIQTAKMKMLIADLELPENLKILQNMHADFWLETMKQENEAFESLVKERNTEQSFKISAQAQEQKFVLGNRLNKLLDMLELAEEGGEAPELKPVLAQVNEAIVQSMSTARSRKTRYDLGKNMPTPEQA
ncbi:MAG: DUF6261 family protein [Microscillaceae bacterium]|nr:DUF6261 family protein [Microscillaceae bacterium]